MSSTERPKYGPPCKCHDFPMCWRNDARYKGGGYWRCAEQERKRSLARYRKQMRGRRALQQKQEARERQKLSSLEKSREMWKQRAQAAEWALRNKRKAA